MTIEDTYRQNEGADLEPARAKSNWPRLAFYTIAALSISIIGYVAQALIRGIVTW